MLQTKCSLSYPKLNSKGQVMLNETSNATIEFFPTFGWKDLIVQDQNKMQ